VVADRLGHADPAITLRVYAHVLTNIQQEATERTNDMLEQAMQKMTTEGAQE
jgi:integrase